MGAEVLKLSIFGLVAAAVSAGAGDSTSARLEAIFSPLADGRSPGLAAMVRQNGRTIFQRGYGVRELRSRAPIDGSTDFRLASCSKQFTALATMLLEPGTPHADPQCEPDGPPRWFHRAWHHVRALQRRQRNGAGGPEASGATRAGG